MNKLTYFVSLIILAGCGGNNTELINEYCSVKKEIDSLMKRRLAAANPLNLPELQQATAAIQLADVKAEAIRKRMDAKGVKEQDVEAQCK